MKKTLIVIAIIIGIIIIAINLGEKKNSCPHQNQYGVVKKMPVGIDRDGKDIYKWYCTECNKYVD